MQHDGTYRSVRENAVRRDFLSPIDWLADSILMQLLHVHPSSVLFTRTPSTPFVIFHEVIETTKRFMRDVTSIEQDWLPELAPHYYSYKQ